MRLKLLKGLSLLARLKAFWWVFVDRRTPLWSKVLLIGIGLAYILWPIDLVPDFVPAAGVVDDLLIIPLLMWLMTRLAPDFVRREAVLKALRRTEPSVHTREGVRIKRAGSDHADVVT